MGKECFGECGESGGDWIGDSFSPWIYGLLGFTLGSEGFQAGKLFYCDAGGFVFWIFEVLQGQFEGGVGADSTLVRVNRGKTYVQGDG